MVAPNKDDFNNDLPDSSEFIRGAPVNINLFEISHQLDKEIQDNREVKKVLSGIEEDAHMNHLKFTRLSDTDQEYSIQVVLFHRPVNWWYRFFKSPFKTLQPSKCKSEQ